jgi:dTDP-4-amino-4,6-dideoxygalactose transaminase
LLAPLANRIRPVPRAAENDPTLHLYVVQIDFSEVPGGRAAIMHRLADRGIGTQVHYLPVNRQPYYRQRYGTVPLPGADAYYERALTLPLYVGMTDADVDSVVAELIAALDR